MNILEIIKKSESERQDGNFGFASRKAYEYAVTEMTELMFGSLGKKVNLELLQRGKLFNLEFRDVVNPIINFPDTSINAVLDAKAIVELNKLNKALNLSYMILELYARNSEYFDRFNGVELIEESLIGPVLHFSLQGHKTLEIMRERLMSNPDAYFKEKYSENIHGNYFGDSVPNDFFLC